MCICACLRVCVCECVVTFTAQLTAICAVVFVVAASRLTGMRRRLCRLIIILLRGMMKGEEVGMDKAFISRSVSMRNACECNTSSSSRCRYELVECQIEYENANDSE